jgi:hypothetical protein
MLKKEGLAKIGMLIAIPIFIALLVTSVPVEACEGSHVTYDETDNVNGTLAPNCPNWRDYPEPMLVEDEPDVEVLMSGFMLVNAVGMIAMAKIYL